MAIGNGGISADETEGPVSFDRPAARHARSWVWALVVGGILLAAAAGAVWLLRRGANTPRQLASIDQPAPPFDLRTVNGGAVSLHDLAGHPLLLSFWTTWCPSCKEELQLLQKTYGEYEDQGLVVVGINVQESPQQVNRLLAGYSVSFPVVLDRNGVVASSYRVRSFPTTVMVDRDGIVRAIHRGELTAVGLKGYLVRLFQ